MNLRLHLIMPSIEHHEKFLVHAPIWVQQSVDLNIPLLGVLTFGSFGQIVGVYDLEDPLVCTKATIEFF